MRLNVLVLIFLIVSFFSCSEKKGELKKTTPPNLNLCPCLMQANSIDSARNCDLNLSDKELRDLGKYCFFHKGKWKKDTLHNTVK